MSRLLCSVLIVYVSLVYIYAFTAPYDEAEASVGIAAADALNSAEYVRGMTTESVLNSHRQFKGASRTRLTRHSGYARKMDSSSSHRYDNKRSHDSTRTSKDSKSARDEADNDLDSSGLREEDIERAVLAILSKKLSGSKAVRDSEGAGLDALPVDSKVLDSKEHKDSRSSRGSRSTSRKDSNKSWQKSAPGRIQHRKQDLMFVTDDAQPPHNVFGVHYASVDATPSSQHYDRYRDSSAAEPRESHATGVGPEEEPEVARLNLADFSHDATAENVYQVAFEDSEDRRAEAVVGYTDDWHPRERPSAGTLESEGLIEPGVASGGSSKRQFAVVQGPMPCSFEPDTTTRLCLREVARDPPALVGPNPGTGATHFTSYLSCCPGAHDAPVNSQPLVGSCTWTVAPSSGPREILADGQHVASGRRALADAGSVGSTTATCIISEDAPCVAPLRKGSTFQVVGAAGSPSEWVRTPAALDISPDNTAYVNDVHQPPVVDFKPADPGSVNPFDFYRRAEASAEQPNAGFMRGKADLYIGSLFGFQGPDSGKVNCGKVTFVASFISEGGAVRCPAQASQHGDILQHGDFSAPGPLPGVKCGSYSITLSTKLEEYITGGFGPHFG